MAPTAGFELAVGDGRPGRAAIGGLPDSSARGAEVVDIRLRGDSGDSVHASAEFCRGDGSGPARLGIADSDPKTCAPAPASAAATMSFSASLTGGGLNSRSKNFVKHAAK